MSRKGGELAYQRRIRRRWQRAGGCVVCGKPRGATTRKAKWRGLKPGARLSKRFCPYHLKKNQESQKRHRERR